MPKVPIDYSNIVIYKLVNKEDYDNANVYIGSTANFTQRKYCHKSRCNNEKDKVYNSKIYQNIRNDGGWNDWNMIEIEKYPCVDNREAESREEYWRIHFNAGLNTKKCHINISSKEYFKQYRLDNYDKLIEYQREYYKKSKN